MREKLLMWCWSSAFGALVGESLAYFFTSKFDWQGGLVTWALLFVIGGLVILVLDKKR